MINVCQLVTTTARIGLIGYRADVELVGSTHRAYGHGRTEAVALVNALTTLAYNVARADGIAAKRTSAGDYLVGRFAE